MNNIQQNLAHGHENLHALTLADDEIGEAPASTTNLEKIALLPFVVSAMAGFAYSWPLMLQINPMMIFRANRNPSPNGLDHWTPETLGQEFLVIRAHEKGQQIDAILFSITERDTTWHRVLGEILGWIRFVGTHKCVTPIEIVEPYQASTPFSSNAWGRIMDGQARLLIDHDYGELDSRADALAWLGRIIADPEAWESPDVATDGTLFPE